jgi:hypothetical protein
MFIETQLLNVLNETYLCEGRSRDRALIPKHKRSAPDVRVRVKVVINDVDE